MLPALDISPLKLSGNFLSITVFIKSFCSSANIFFCSLAELDIAEDLSLLLVKVSILSPTSFDVMDFNPSALALNILSLTEFNFSALAISFKLMSNPSNFWVF